MCCRIHYYLRSEASINTITELLIEEIVAPEQKRKAISEQTLISMGYWGRNRYNANIIYHSGEMCNAGCIPIS